MGRWTSPDKPFADQHHENPQTWNLYNYARNNPLRYTDDYGSKVKDIILKVDKINEVTNKSYELGDVTNLGPKSNGQYFGYAVNIVASFTDDDSSDNYNPHQTAFVISPKVQNTDPHRPGEWGVEGPDNPGSENIKSSPNEGKLAWADNPGFKSDTAPAGTNNEYFAIFKSTVTPKKGTSGEKTDKVLYWGVQFSVVDGKIKNAVAEKIDKKQYEEWVKKYGK